MKLTRVPFPSLTYWHKFVRPDGTIFEVETTKIEYNSLRFGGTPSHPEGRWWCSYEGIKVPVNCYTTDGKRYFVSTDGEETITLESKYLLDEELTPEGVAYVNKMAAGAKRIPI